MLIKLFLWPFKLMGYMFKLMFKDSDVNQDIDKGKNFYTKIQIENVH